VHLEALEASGVFGLLADSVEHLVNHLRALGLVALGPVASRACVLVHEVTWVEELAERRRAHSVGHTGLMIEEHRAGHILYARGLVLKHVYAAELPPPMLCSSHTKSQNLVPIWFPHWPACICAISLEEAA
jgi:hypothetical protein